jgi:hypothetical protein
VVHEAHQRGIVPAAVVANRNVLPKREVEARLDKEDDLVRRVSKDTLAQKDCLA